MRKVGKGFPHGIRVGTLAVIFAVLMFHIALFFAAPGKVQSRERFTDAWSEGGAFRAPDVGTLTSVQAEPQRTYVTQYPATVFSGAVFARATPLSSVSVREGLVRYTVRRGDTIPSIATRFRISQDTLRWANGGLRRPLSLGEELTILPVTGVLHDIVAGDTLETIAGLYGISEASIASYNPRLGDMLQKQKGSVIVPNGKQKKNAVLLARTTTAQLPDVKGYFSLPLVGWNFGKLHDENAVDIGNRCGLPVTAAADGLVIPDASYGDGSSGWNGGYGIFVLVEHPNGTQTRYAHLREAAAHVGDIVSRSTVIGYVGQTGNSHGPEGCHLHFEVLGAKNPFAK